MTRTIHGFSTTDHGMLAGDTLERAAAFAAEAKAGKRAYTRLALADGGEGFLKVYTRRKSHTLLRRLGQSRARREAVGYAAFGKVSAPVAGLLAWGERRVRGLWDRSFVLTRVVAGPSAAERFIADRGELGDVLAAARALATLHGKGLAHGDPGLSNLILSPAGPVWLDPGEQCRLTPESRSADLSQFLGSLMALGGTQAQCEETLGVYQLAAGGPTPAPDLWARVRASAFDELKRRTGAKVIGGKHSHDALHATLEAMPASKVLDAPCGEGLLSEFLRYRGWRVHTADIDPGNMRAPGYEVTTIDLNRALPIADGEYDVVVSANSLHRLFNPGGAVREFHRILRPGGTLVLNLNNYASVERRLRFFLYGSLDNAVNSGACQQTTAAPEANVRVAFLMPSLVLAMREAGFADLRVIGGKRTLPQTLLLPLAWLAAGLGALAPRRSRERNALSVSNHMGVLGGGNYVVVTARRPG